MDKNNKDLKESKTKSGEFVCSYFGWQTLDGQKEKAEELENLTKNAERIKEELQELNKNNNK